MGMKRKELAASSGLSYPYVSEIENGHKEPSHRALRKLAEALELPTPQLLELAGRLREEGHEGSVLLESEAPSRSAALPETERRVFALTTPSPQPGSAGRSFDYWLEETIRRVVREELHSWVLTELLDSLRSEPGRTAEKNEDE
jgi:transcriptional regulator with XRE-family HTH domain